MDMHGILQQDPEIWDLFTRKEEYQNPLRDSYDRFPYYASDTCKTRDIFEPRASQYLVEHGYQVEYPDGDPFAVCLTHDIDSVYRSASSKGLCCHPPGNTEWVETVEDGWNLRVGVDNRERIIRGQEKPGAKI